MGGKEITVKRAPTGPEKEKTVYHIACIFYYCQSVLRKMGCKISRRQQLTLGVI